MPQPTETVREFVSEAYLLISASSPNIPLPNGYQEQAIKILNRLLKHYSATGFMTTVSKQVDFTVNIGQGEVTFGQPDYIPTPDIITQGRLVNLENAWLTLEGVTYPLIDQSRNEFFSSYKYEPLQGLPRYIIVKPQTNLTTVQLFPAPSQQYLLSVYGKFQPFVLTVNDDMSELPTYFFMFLQFALAKKMARFTGRNSAWTPDLEQDYLSLKRDMEANTSQNLDINVNNESWLNGAYRVRSGV